jgi:hypothetical protein
MERDKAAAGVAQSKIHITSGGNMIARPIF